MAYALVTGANRGLGYEMAKQLLEKYDYTKIFCTCRNIKEDNDLSKLHSKHPNRIILVEMDLLSEDSIKAAAETVAKAVPKLEVIVNNAAVYHPYNTINEITTEEFMETIKVNTLAPLLVIKSFLPLIKKGERKLIVNVTSRSGSIMDNTTGRNCSYRVSKAALNMATKTLAVELSPEGITLIALHPGMVRTDLTKTYWATLSDTSAWREPDLAASQMLDIIANSTKDDNGKFISWNREVIPW